MILVESDLLYEPSVITKLLKSEHPNVALVDTYRTGLDGTVVSVSADNVITQVIPSSLQSANFDFSDKFKTLNIYKFSAEFCSTTFRKLLGYYARIIDDNCYYELILGILIYMQQVQIHAETLDGELWAEVDDPNDLRAATFTFVPSSRRQRLESSFGANGSDDRDDSGAIQGLESGGAELAGVPEAELPQERAQRGRRVAPAEQRGIPPWRITSRSSMESAPVTIPATIAVIFPAGLVPIEVPRCTSAASSPCRPQDWARPITGTNPAHDTTFGSSKCARVRDAPCNNRIYEVPSRLGCWKCQQLPSSQLRGHLPCQNTINTPHSSVDPGLAVVATRTIARLMATFDRLESA